MGRKQKKNKRMEELPLITKAKRPRLDEAQDTSGQASRVFSSTHQDSFDEIFEAGVLLHRNGSVRQTWMEGDNQVNWLECQSKTLDSNDDLAQNFEQIESEIKQVHKELNNVKGQFMQAAKECAQGYQQFQGKSCSSSQVFTQARRRCNPFECLGEGVDSGLNHGLFVNRSAMKLANIDCILGHSLLPPNQQSFCFCDLCGAPGGFAEYLFYKASKTQQVKGYGMSLGGTNQDGRGCKWKMSHLNDFYEPNQNCDFVVCKGKDGTGDIYNWDNVEHLRKIVHEKVNLVVADGGFDAQRDCEDQEGVTLRLVVSQVAAAMFVLSSGGTLIVKIFGTATTPIHAMMHSLMERFEKIAILKPVSSRPASSERYLICINFNCAESELDCKQLREEIVNKSSLPENKVNRRLKQYLLESELAIANLNLKACKAILTTMGQPEFVLSGVSKTKQDELYPFSTKAKTLIKKYRQSWKL